MSLSNNNEYKKKKRKLEINKYLKVRYQRWKSSQNLTFYG